METTSATTIATSGSPFDQQVLNMKNKRKKFNPQYMLSNSSSDDEGGGRMNNDVTDNGDDNRSKNSSDEDVTKINSNNNLIVSPKINDNTKGQNNNNDSPPPAPSIHPPPFISPTKLLQTFGSLQQQQQLLQQAAMAAVSSASAIAPQYQQQQLQQNPSMNLSEAEAKFREYAFKTMQDLLSIYGLSLSPNDIVDALKQQHLGQQSPVSGGSGSNQLEPPTPPRTPIISANVHSTPKSNEKHYNNNNDDAKENYEENSMRKSTANATLKLLPNVTLTPTSKLVKTENNDSDNEDYQVRHAEDSNYSDDESSSRLGGRQSVSESGGLNGGDDSDHESDLYTDASSFDSSKLSLKNVESLMDKSSQMGFYSPMMHLATLQNDQIEKQLIAEYSKYLTKYQSYLDCHNEQCQMENQREHYHCYDIQCSNKILNKKEEIIRHLKWHKKRSESLNHGFLRFTSSDDCSVQFGYCQHNRKQTHYHCIQNKCDKTYISTSDVQMHSNYHRKDSAIYQEGFQRYRATEKCLVQHCIFYGQCTTHFHCRRCKFTFKNKADMEKHKTYHMKDEQLLKDGFKKFLKSEPCKVDGCRFSLICNHIHCVRSGCTYVLHSSGQLLSHKRKHERMDAEMAYRRFKMGQSKDMTPSELNALQQFHGLDLSSKPSTPSTPTGLPNPSSETTHRINKLLDNASMENLNMLLNQNSAPTSLSPEILQQIHQQQKRHYNADSGDENDYKNGNENGDSLEDGIPKSVIHNVPTSMTQDENKTPSIEEVEQIISQYFTDHCTKQQNEQNEPLNLNSKSSQSQRNLIECFMNNSESHLHCLIPGCDAVVPRSLKDISEHLRMHELNRGADGIIQNSNLLQITSIEGFFNRKRGRPPKNRVVEVYNNTHHPPQAIFTSFKLERNDTKGASGSQNPNNGRESKDSVSNSSKSKVDSESSGHDLLNKIQIYQSSDRCPDTSCVYQKLLHYHCNYSKYCHFSTNQLAVMNLHLSDFHTSIQIQENFDYYDRNYDCKLQGCSFNKITSHFHCLLCKFSFAPASEMNEHVCEDNIEDSYENFDIVESEIKRLPMQRKSLSIDQNYNQREQKSPADFFDEKMFTHQNKVALNSDVDLIKTSRVAIPPKSEAAADDEKVSVVRAAGTFFPENSDTEHKLPPQTISTPFEMPSKDDCCDRPFCKLKRKKHSHCDLCNQAFTDMMKLKIHFLKHSQTKLGNMFDMNSADSSEDCEKQKKEENVEPHDLSKPSANTSNLGFPTPSLPQVPSASSMVDNLALQNLHLANLAQIYQQNSLYYQSMYPFLSNQNLPGLGLEQQLPLMQFPFPAALAGGGFDFVGGLPPPGLPGNKSPALLTQKRKLEQLQQELQQSKMMKMEERPLEYKKKYKDDSVPTGYLKFRFNQDCNFPNCGYRNHQSHFHCCRKDCFYSFCDKTRFVQHTARHERLDKLMGDDFKQYRANMHCGHNNCAYNKNIGPHNKSSHFHCLKCNYICSDTNKVVAHRRQHSKQEYIRMAGFRKISNNEHCNIPDPNTPDGECPYTLKQTHYHCLVCQMGVLSRAQLPSHRHRITPGEENDDQSEVGENGVLIIGDNQTNSDDNNDSN